MSCIFLLSSQDSFIASEEMIGHFEGSYIILAWVLGGWKLAYFSLKQKAKFPYL